MIKPKVHGDASPEETSVVYKDDFDSGMVLKELREKLGDYLSFVSTDFVVCDVCHLKVKTWDFPGHVENTHYDPPQRVWSKRPRVGRRQMWRQL